MKVTYHDSTAKGVINIVKIDGRTNGKIEQSNTGQYFYRKNEGCRSPMFRNVDAVKKHIEAG